MSQGEPTNGLPPLDELAARRIMEGAREVAAGHRRIVAEALAAHVAEHHATTFPLDRLDPERLRFANSIISAVAQEIDRVKVEILREAALTAARMLIAHGNEEHGPMLAVPRRRRTRKEIALQKEIDATVRAALERGEEAAS